VLRSGIVTWGAPGFQTREKVLDVEPMHATRTREKTDHILHGSIVGAVLVLSGVVLVAKGRSCDRREWILNQQRRGKNFRPKEPCDGR